MAIAQEDRIAFSLKIVNADTEVKSLDQAKAQLQVEIVKLQRLDTANKNLFIPVNSLVNAYQLELTSLDGNVRTSIIEQDILDSASKKLQNHFFPNDTTVSVASLTGTHNVWTKVKPYANTYAVGRAYSEAFAGSTTKETDLITAALSLIASASVQTDIQNTSGQHAVEDAGTCSLLSFTTESTCITGGGTWTPGPLVISTFDTAVTLKINLVSTINSLISFLNSEKALIVTTDPVNAAQNQAAIDAIDNVIIPALNTWLSYPDFQVVPGSVTPGDFDSYDSNLLAPTKLHSAQLNALQSALHSRATFVASRIAQVSNILGSVVQDLNTGDITASNGLYGKRYSFLSLRLNALGGSLMQLTSMQTASDAQESIKKGTLENKAIYLSILPTSSFRAPANGTVMVNLIDPSFVSVGDTVYIVAEGQQELLRAVKSVNGTLVTLNDTVPAKYTTVAKTRLYRDIS